jgi:hypothetical protein
MVSLSDLQLPGLVEEVRRHEEELPQHGGETHRFNLSEACRQRQLVHGAVGHLVVKVPSPLASLMLG